MKAMTPSALRSSDLPGAAAVRPVWGWVLLAGVVAGTLDLLFTVAWWAPQGVAPVRVLHSVAAWAIGREAALSGGVATAAFGAALHYALMTAMAAGYVAFARRFREWLRHPVATGLLYGAACYTLLHVIVVPNFSAAPPRVVRPEWMLACLAAHMLLVGVPCALIARHALRSRRH